MDGNWTRDEKRAILAAFEDKPAPRDRAQLLSAFALSESRLQLWGEQSAAGELDDDQDDIDDPRDENVWSLARFFHDMITRGTSNESIAPTTPAGRVLYDRSGRWRANYLARARSALAHVLTVVEPDAERILFTKKGVTAADAVAELRAYWGVDRFPILVKAEKLNNPSVSPLEIQKQNTERATRIRTIAHRGRWSDKVFGSAEAIAALSDWLANAPDARVEAPGIPAPGPPTWHPRSPVQWPPGKDADHLSEVVRRYLGPMDELGTLGEDRYLRVLRRRAADLVTDYAATVEEWASLLAYLRGYVIRPWLPSSLETFFDAEEEEAYPAEEQVKLVAAAIASLCLYRAVMDWNQDAMTAARRTEQRHSIDGDTDSTPFDRYRVEVIAEKKRHDNAKAAAEGSSSPAGSIAHTALRGDDLLRPPQRQEIKPPVLPLFVRQATEAVQDLYAKAMQMQQAQHPVFVARYIDARYRLTPNRMPAISRRVTVIADYIAGLTASGRNLRVQLTNHQRERLRAALRESALADKSAYELANDRNAAIEVQKVDPEQALNLAWGAYDRAGQNREESRHSTRQVYEMRQQLCLIMAGTSVQIVEQHLQRSAEERMRIAQNGAEERLVAEVRRRVRGAHQWSEAALDLIVRIADDHEQLRGQRYNDGHIADKNFVLTANIYCYRIACAGAAAQAIYGFTTDIDFDQALAHAHHRLTTYPYEIASGDIPRAIQALLWHAFMAGMTLPALTENANPVFAQLDAIGRPRSPREGSGAASTAINAKRLEGLTQRLVDLKWNAGAVGGFRPGSPAWRELDSRSDGAYSKWRERWGDSIVPKSDE